MMTVSVLYWTKTLNWIFTVLAHWQYREQNTKPTQFCFRYFFFQLRRNAKKIDFIANILWPI